MLPKFQANVIKNQHLFTFNHNLTNQTPGSVQLKIVAHSIFVSSLAIFYLMFIIVL